MTTLADAAPDHTVCLTCGGRDGQHGMCPRDPSAIVPAVPLGKASPDQLRQALAAVMDVHLYLTAPVTGVEYCGHCAGNKGPIPREAQWPCRTVRAVADAGIEVPA